MFSKRKRTDHFHRLGLGLLGYLCLSVIPLAVSDAQIVFNRDVRPILSENCFFCHGQDANKRQADLRLDTFDGLGQSEAVTPGNPDKSPLISRIRATDPVEIMPPPDSNRRLTDQQKSILERWIAEGARFEKHWSFELPKPVELPQVVESDRSIHNPIDRFVLSKLSELQIAPAPVAEKEILIRRLSLDLTGLPPTIAEVDAFVADNSENAYEKLVDRLLQSPHYGERMALPWLEAARFADTHGYQKDNLRTMWAWRDWVIEAFNSNMPYDQFTIEQLAGDLLPHPSIGQLIATGFNRNHRINGEAGAISEEFRSEYVADRVETTSTVWLGLTIACARCHDHKFDSITQRDYYQLFAFFNNVEENGVDGVEAVAAPSLTVPLAGFATQIADAERKLESLRRQLISHADQLVDEKQEWVRHLLSLLRRPDGSKLWSLVEPIEVVSRDKMQFTKQADYSILASGPNPLNDVHTIRFSISDRLVTAIRLEVLPDASHTQGKLARSFDGSFVLSELELQRRSGSRPAQSIRIRSAQADGSRRDWPIEAAIDRVADTGWSSDGSQKPETCQALFILDEPVLGEADSELVIHLRYESKEEQSMIGRFRLSTTSLVEPTLDPMEMLPSSLIDALGSDRQHRQPEQQSIIDRTFRERTPLLEFLRNRIASEQRRLEGLRRSSETSVMIMRESSSARNTYVHLRGAYDKPGEQVEANIPQCFSPVESRRPLNRLDLARWLVHPSNPLTARVAVNRYWQMYFGTGLVKTSEDFGTQGDWPSHPELLDWLALEFIRSGWDVKAIQRLIVTSATYRQSSRITPTSYEYDPENRWLARGPRFRLPAQLLRDQALFVSGLLVPRIGGPPVKPYQPDGLWEGVAGINSNTIVYQRDAGESLYRRSLYTFWKRAVPPPSMMIFDAADREVCSVKRLGTNTPLQALNMLNDVTYVEAARSLAVRVLRDTSATTVERIQQMWRHVLARFPDETEMRRLREALKAYEFEFSGQPTNAARWIAIGDSEAEPGLSPVLVASWTALAALVLNLDETLTKE